MHSSADAEPAEVFFFNDFVIFVAYNVGNYFNHTAKIQRICFKTDGQQKLLIIIISLNAFSRKLQIHYVFKFIQTDMP